MENIKDTHKKYNFIMNYIGKVGKQKVKAKYGKTYPQLKLGGETELLTILRKGYPVFTKTNTGYNLHLIFPRNRGNLLGKTLEENKNKLITYLNQSTKGKSKFSLSYSVFLPGFEKDIYQEYYDSLSFIDKAEIELERQREIQRKEEERMERLMEKEELLKETDTQDKGIIDPFGSGFLTGPASVPQSKPVAKPQPKPKPVIQEPKMSKPNFDEIDQLAASINNDTVDVGLPDEELPF
ncbi:hypothetical protein KK120_18730 [Virgibacillus dakarensis]|nr:hypothetical protein [Virgibacillus dakarensis]